MTGLPHFRYHPDPLASGSVVISDATCECCGEARGHVYTGPCYAETELEDALCPWCIADGSAHERLDVTFVDSEAFDDDAAEAAEAAQSCIMERTPGFHAWQPERWPSCCDEPAAFVGPFGIAEIRERFPKIEGSLMTSIVYDLGVSGGAAQRLLDSLKRDEAPTAFVFRCLHCDGMPAYVDRM
ncbi:MAG: CbrC family protein [Gemmatimonadaceae bacterium]|nr:CbrC family protein [Gemmatimonadaceae bacterium]